MKKTLTDVAFLLRVFIFTQNYGDYKIVPVFYTLILILTKDPRQRVHKLLELTQKRGLL